MRHDAYGLPVSTEAPAALEAYDRALQGLLSWDGRALDLFWAVGAQDPALALGHAGAAICLFLEERFTEAQEAAKVARGAAGSQTERLEPVAPRVVELGGSRAQRDVFHDTLLEACFRAGDMDRAERLLAERIARRPDHFWKSRTAMDIGTAAR
jgi:pentatricopeptide repeat protein